MLSTRKLSYLNYWWILISFLPNTQKPMRKRIIVVITRWRCSSLFFFPQMAHFFFHKSGFETWVFIGPNCCFCSWWLPTWGPFLSVFRFRQDRNQSLRQPPKSRNIGCTIHSSPFFPREKLGAVVTFWWCAAVLRETLWQEGTTNVPISSSTARFAFTLGYRSLSIDL